LWLRIYYFRLTHEFIKTLDSLTHIAVGAILGEAFSKRSLGKHGMFLGIVGQSLPDIDFIAAFWLDPANNLLAHRGFTHSLLFLGLASFGCALAAERWHRKHDIKLYTWALFFAFQIFVHLFLDAMNVYGIGLFEPFYHERISFNTLFVADPLFSVWPGIAAVLLLWLPNHHQARRWWIRVGLVGCSLYLSAAIFIKFLIHEHVAHDLKDKNISYSRYFTTPTPLNCFLWYTVAESKEGYYLGYRSIFDTVTTSFRYFPRQDSLLNPIHDHEDLQHLKRFSKNYYVVAQKNDSLVFSDIRFGQVFGWNNPDAPFVFQYHLEHPDQNLLVIQRGRFARWDIENISATVKRIKGDKILKTP
jgi:inner membrane protein